MPSRAPVRLPEWAQRLLAVARVDWDPPTRQPPARRVVLATVVSVVASLVADAFLVALGTHLFPSTSGFVHFRPADYGSLTVIGVVTACAGWPIVTRVTSTPRWLFLRLAVLVTAVLLLPDAWILVRGEPAEAVVVLVAMHLSIAVVTYNVLVYLAPAGRRRPAARAVAEHPAPRRGRPAALEAVRMIAEQVERDTAFPTGGPVFRPAPTTALSIVGSSSLATVVPLSPQPATSPTRSWRTPADVARPPSTLAEPRSAVRVLPSPVGARPASPPSSVDLDQGGEREWAGLPSGAEHAGRSDGNRRGRHVARP